ncbi:hypothetical protein [Parasitella parasitica]|uniref:Rho GDP-dissociation inhibitor n=1 Tax=Parasitella parasitica TaxID=35722 RepID=A0A0B7NAM2_9FUNG|nr:hypothetical protein [Parasitella parasitica]
MSDNEEPTSYKPGEKKSSVEYLALDAEDESLNKWKMSLGLNPKDLASNPTPDDPRKIIIESMALVVEGRPDIEMKLSTDEDVKNAEKSLSTPFTIKEGAEYRMKVKFRVQHEMVSGLSFQISNQEKMFEPEEAPLGILYRGTYTVKSKFLDDDNVTHLEWEWAFDIKKDW